MRTSAAMEKLWEAILFTSRVTDDPVKAWEEHNADLHDRCAYLNSLHIRSLHYTAENGTDLTVGYDPRRRVEGRRRHQPAGHLLQPQHPHGGVLHLSQAGRSRGHRLCQQAP